MLVLEWKERAFIEKVNSSVFVDFRRPYWCTKTVHQYGVFIYTKLYKGAWNVSANNSETVGHKDLRLGQIVCTLVFYNISFSWFLPLDGFQFIFLLRDSENDLYRIYLVQCEPRQKVNHKTVHKAFFPSKFRRKNRKHPTNFICGRFHRSTEPVVRSFLKLFVILFGEMLITVYQIQCHASFYVNFVDVSSWNWNWKRNEGKNPSHKIQHSLGKKFDCRPG